MLATPSPSLAETRDNQAFNTLLWALSRPGLARTLPEPGEAPIITALLDRECRAYSADPLLLPDIMRTGAEVTDLDQADHVFLGAMTDAQALNELAVGSDLYPDEGATVIIRAHIGTGSRVRLTGPGIDGHVTSSIDGLPDGFWTARASKVRYPKGFDVFLLDGDQIVGVPRSTAVEVL